MLFLLLCVPLATVIGLPTCGVPSTPFHIRQKRVIGGREIEHSAMPWIVALQDKDSFTFCSGTLISDRHVLTAAHCFIVDGFCENMLKYQRLNWTSICHGLKYNDVPCEGVGVTKYIPKRAFNLEPFFESNCNKNDFVILELEKPVPNAMPVCLPVEKSVQGGDEKTEFISAGYSPNYEAHEIPLPLGKNRQLRAAVVGERVQCNPEDPEDVICAKQSNRGAICQGDSGGPLMEFQNNRYTVVGVHSTANSTQCYPSGLYKGISGIQKSTDVLKHLPEILEAINAN